VHHSVSSGNAALGGMGAGCVGSSVAWESVGNKSIFRIVPTLTLTLVRERLRKEIVSSGNAALGGMETGCDGSHWHVSLFVGKKSIVLGQP